MVFRDEHTLFHIIVQEFNVRRSYTKQCRFGSAVTDLSLNTFLRLRSNFFHPWDNVGNGRSILKAKPLRELGPHLLKLVVRHLALTHNNIVDTQVLILCNGLTLRPLAD